MMTKYERIIETYKRMYPEYYSRTTECRPSSRYCLLANLNDGSKLEYNFLDNTIRDVTRLYSSTATNMDEETWRREFGRKLRRILAERGVNQERLSDATGISRQMITRYVRGHSTPSGYILSKIVNALGCDGREFVRFGYDDKE